MSIGVIILLLLATLTFVVVGVTVLVTEQGRKATLGFTVTQETGPGLKRFREGFERRIVRTDVGRRLRRELDNVDLGWRVGDTVLGGTAIGLVALIVTYRIGGPVFSIVVMTLLVFGVRMLLRRREEQRAAKFIEQLPDLARLLANAAEAGLSLRAGLTVAAQETEEPTRGELKRVVSELAVGSSLDEALSRMGERLPSRELAVLVNVLVIQSRAGGRIVTALHGITEALEVRRDLRREVATLIAGSKATVFAVSCLGGLMVLLVHQSVKGGLRTLLADPIGLTIFLVSLALFLAGMVAIRRATRVEV